MNETTKKLAKKAGFTSCTLSMQTMLEAFAKLIVRECISALDKEVYIATREDGEQAFHDVILLEHFGVEE